MGKGEIRKGERRKEKWEMGNGERRN